MNFILGTAQIGNDYGVSNKFGKVSDEDFRKVLEIAKKSGVNYLDTASNYGDSEERIGKFYELTKDFLLITKTANSSKQLSTKSKIKFIKEEFINSLKKTKREKVEILLVHDAADIMGCNGCEIYDSLTELKKKGLVNKLGVSVYSVNDLKKISSEISIDVLQYPINVFNQEFLNCKEINLLKESGVELHARSIFLQGILLMKTSELDDYFNAIKRDHKKYLNFLKDKNLSRLMGAVNFIKTINEIDAAVFGVQNHKELKEIIHAFNSKTVNLEYKNFFIKNKKITNPSFWKITR